MVEYGLSKQTGFVDFDESELRRLAGPVFDALTRAAVPLVVTNPRLDDDPLVFVNESFCKLTGYDPADVLGRNCRFLQGPGTDRQTVAAIREALRTHHVYEGELLNYRKDRTSFWNELRITPIVGADDRPDFMLATLTDVSDARRTKNFEEALVTRQEQLDQVSGRLQFMVSVSGAAASWEWALSDGRIFGDSRFEALYGLDAQQSAQGVTPKTFFSIIHPDDQLRIRLAIGAVLRGAEVFEKDFRIRTPAGPYHWVRAKGLCRHDTEDRRSRFSGAFIDINEQKRVEEQLRIAQVAGGIGTFEYVDGFATVSVSEQFCTLLGLHPAADLPMRTINSVVHADDPHIIDSGCSANIGPAPHIECRITRPRDGAERWITRRGEYVRDEGARGPRFVGVIYDVTEAKRIEAQLRDLNETLEQRVRTAIDEQIRTEEALRQSQKMEAVGQLTGGIAHDFNNLLTGITGSLDLLSTRLEQGRYKDVQRYISGAQGAAKRAAALTHRLLAFSRRQTLDPKPVDANKLVAGMEELVRRTVGPQVETKVIAAKDVWPVLVDPNQLENALLNLCINARDAMPSGGTLTIETANLDLVKASAETEELLPGRYVLLRVSDTGTGMSPEVMQRAFDPFFTTKPLGEGTGLGLSMIFGFVKQSGGQVRIASEVGRGTSMSLYLPYYQGEVEGVAETDHESGLAAGRGETVLLLDDEPTIRMLVLEVLEDAGYRVIEAQDGASAIKLLQSDTRIDLLITDVGLPGGINGRQVADAGRAVRPALKVLFITGYAEFAMAADRQIFDEATRILTKPFTMDALANDIKELIAPRSAP